MPTTSRRDVISSAALAAGPGLLWTEVWLWSRRKKASRRRPRPCQASTSQWRRCEGRRRRIPSRAFSYTAKYFGNATVAETKQALAGAGLTSEFVPIPIATVAVKLNSKLILCDAGGGGQVQAFNANSGFVSGKMMASMKAADIDPRAVETILVSHFHGDHIFGLLEKKTNAPVFPDAEIILPSAEYKWWTDPLVITRLPGARRPLARRIQANVPHWRNALPVEGEDEVVPGIYLVSAPGHTPDHAAFHLTPGNAELMISNDAHCVLALCARHPEWYGAFDQDGTMAEASRRKLLDRVVADHMLICGSHFPWPGLAKIAKDGGSYAYTTLRTA
jgi:glyoxylase-like metal-dependent hydrolase (beta-lactamase superfamily II)